MLVLWIFLAGCGSLATPPVAYLDAWLVTGDRSPFHQSRGLYLEILNTSDRPILEVEVAADLFVTGEETRNDDPRGLASHASVRVEPGDTAILCVNLDRVPSDLEPGRIRVERAVLDSGEVWTNSGLHIYEGEVR